jgi:hypothetical protein
LPNVPRLVLLGVVWLVEGLFGMAPLRGGWVPPPASVVAASSPALLFLDFSDMCAPRQGRSKTVPAAQTFR